MNRSDFDIREVKSRLAPWNWELVYLPQNLMLGGLYDFSKDGSRRKTIERVIELILQKPEVIQETERTPSSDLKQKELSEVRKLWSLALYEESEK